jgi:hypothetical protein
LSNYNETALQDAVDDLETSKADKLTTYTKTEVDAALTGKEPSITAGTSAQYYRGDKSMQTLNKAAVGLSNVDNTSDAGKPISTATQTALAGKANSSHTHTISEVTGLQTALDTKANSLSLAAVATAGTYASLTSKPRYEALATLPADLSGYPDGSIIVVTG